MGSTVDFTIGRDFTVGSTAQCGLQCLSAPLYLLNIGFGKLRRAAGSMVDSSADSTIDFIADSTARSTVDSTIKSVVDSCVSAHQ